MELEYLTILEKRVKEMLEMIKTLREENHRLECQLTEREKSTQALRQERSEVRGRVEKVLTKLNHLVDDENHSILETEVEQATSY